MDSFFLAVVSDIPQVCYIGVPYVVVIPLYYIL